MKRIVIIIAMMAIVTVGWLVFGLAYRKYQIQKYHTTLEIIAQKITSTLSENEKIRHLYIAYSPLNDLKGIKNLLPGAIFVNNANIPRNKKGEQDLFELRERIQKINTMYLNEKIPPPFYTIDQEWGYIRRLEKKFTDFPSAMTLGEAIAKTSRYDLAMLTGFYTCIELRKLGIQWPFIPVVDVQTNPNNPIIGTRSFGSHSQLVSDIAEQFVLGMQSARCMSTVKHYPGHGDTHLDSHKSLPVVNKSMQELEKVELAPYTKILTSETPPHSIMTAHIVFPQVSDEPATLSSIWLNDILRKKYKYKGLIITDDLKMQAIKIYGKKNRIKNLHLKALRAGTDMLLLLAYNNGTSKSIHSIINADIVKKPAFKKRIAESVTRVIVKKLHLGVLNQYLRQNMYQWSPEEIAMADMILKYSDEQEEHITNMETQLPTATSINNFISLNGIKLIKSSLNDPPTSFKGLPLFSDVRAGGKLHKVISENVESFHDIKDLQNYSCEDYCVILHSGRISLHEIIRLKQNKKVIIFSTVKPFPAKKFKKLLAKDDIFVTSFSNTVTSFYKLIETYLNDTLPDRASAITE